MKEPAFYKRSTMEAIDMLCDLKNLIEYYRKLNKANDYFVLFAERIKKDFKTLRLKHNLKHKHIKRRNGYVRYLLETNSKKAL